MGRILGIDFGKARIGLAISDPGQRIAFPVGMIQVAQDFKATVEKIRTEIAPYPQIDIIVLGLPLQLNGKEGEMATLVRSFGQVLQESFSLPVMFWDERLTSAQVERLLRDAGMNRKKRTIHSDEMAAATILQNYLDTQNRS